MENYTIFLVEIEKILRGKVFYRKLSFFQQNSKNYLGNVSYWGDRY